MHSFQASHILVNNRQKGNPVLQHIRNIPWQFSDINPDFIVGEMTCLLYLSLRYHQLNSTYIHERLNELGKLFKLRILLVLVDIKDPDFYLKDLIRITMLSDITMILSWSLDEAGRYIETYKSYEHKNPDILMGKEEIDENISLYEELDNSYEPNFIPIMNFMLSSKSVNKTDCQMLYKAFDGNLTKFIKVATSENGLKTLELIPGIGITKAQKLKSIFNAKFVI